MSRRWFPLVCSPFLTTAWRASSPRGEPQGRLLNHRQVKIASVTVLASVAGRRGTTSAVIWSNHTKLGLSGLAGQGCGLAFGARGGLLGGDAVGGEQGDQRDDGE